MTDVYRLSWPGTERESETVFVCLSECVCVCVCVCVGFMFPCDRPPLLTMRKMFD